MARMTHPDSGTEIEVRADQVQLYQSQGWRTVTGKKPAPTTPETSTVTSPTSA